MHCSRAGVRSALRATETARVKKGLLAMAISLTNSAAERVRTYLERRGHGLGLRVGVRKTGCSGYAYVIDYADSVANRRRDLRRRRRQGDRRYEEPGADRRYRSRFRQGRHQRSLQVSQPQHQGRVRLRRELQRLAMSRNTSARLRCAPAGPACRKPKGSRTTGRLKPSRAGMRARSLQGCIHGVFQAARSATPRTTATTHTSEPTGMYSRRVSSGPSYASPHHARQCTLRALHGCIHGVFQAARSATPRTTATTRTTTLPGWIHGVFQAARSATPRQNRESSTRMSNAS